MIWEIVSSIAAAVSVVFAIFVYLKDHYNKKRAETIKAVDHVLNSYYELVKENDPNKNYYDYTKFLSIVERFATDANERVLNKRIIKNRLSIFLINEYEQRMKDIIDQRRKQFSRDSYYEQIETLIKFLKSK